METQAPIIAFLYDFDKTLCTTDMEDYAFIPSLGYTPAEFWGRANAFSSAGILRGDSYIAALCKASAEHYNNTIGTGYAPCLFYYIFMT